MFLAKIKIRYNSANLSCPDYLFIAGTTSTLSEVPGTIMP